MCQPPGLPVSGIASHAGGGVKGLEQICWKAYQRQGGGLRVGLLRCRPDTKNAQYQQTIKSGDLLLNRLQKLSKVIDIE